MYDFVHSPYYTLAHLPTYTQTNGKIALMGKLLSDRKIAFEKKLHLKGLKEFGYYARCLTGVKIALSTLQPLRMRLLRVSYDIPSSRAH